MHSEMIAYKVYCKDYKLKKGTLLGVLSERRNHLRKESQVESDLARARLTFGRFTKTKGSIFIVPVELEEGDATKALREREVLSAREFQDIVGSRVSTERKQIAAPRYDPARLQENNRQSNDTLGRTRNIKSCEKHYSFSERPFEAGSDLKFLYISPSYQAAFDCLIAGLKNQAAFVSITGEPGTGKTTLIHFYVNNVSKKVKTVLISHASLGFTELLKSILLELNLEIEQESGEAVRNQLHDYLVHKRAGDDGLVVIIDDAQDLQLGVIEELGNLLSQETRLQVVFVGQPDVENKLHVQELPRLSKRKGIRCRIRALSQKQSRKYIEYRLSLVGGSISETFTPKAINIVIRYARGIPRAINILCENALLMGSDSNGKSIDSDIICEVIKQMEDGNLLELLRHRYRGEFRRGNRWKLIPEGLNEAAEPHDSNE